jgi:RNA polymerase sigma-70 factor, ECF subfamily
MLTPRGAEAVTSQERNDAGQPLEAFFMENFGRLVDALAPISADAVDAIQDAFIEAHLQWDAVSNLDSPYAWVRKVAIRKLQDRHRRQLTNGRLLATLAVLRKEVASPEARRLDLTNAMRSLPMRQRMAVGLFYLEDMSLKDISEATGLSEGAIKSALHAGRDARS